MKKTQETWYKKIQSGPITSSPLELRRASQALIPQGRAMRKRVGGLISIAPMIDKTNRHFRRFLRLMTRSTVLYTEMITALAIIHGKRKPLLDFSPIEHPLILQLGGDNPEHLKQAISIAEDWGYDEYNLNVGCPSEKVQRGSFGACLMADPSHVAELMDAMAQVTKKPVSIKHRVGITGFGYERQSYEELAEFVSCVAAAGSERFVVHARIAMLEGLNPRENRTIPPLRYQDVYQLKQQFPDLHIEINGQIKDVASIRQHLKAGMDGVMIGRASYENPSLMAYLDAFERDWQGGGSRNPEWPLPSFDRSDLVLKYADYLDQESGTGLSPRAHIWPILELFNGIPGSRKYRQILSQAYRPPVSVLGLAKSALEALSID